MSFLALLKVEVRRERALQWRQWRKLLSRKHLERWEADGRWAMYISRFICEVIFLVASYVIKVVKLFAISYILRLSSPCILQFLSLSLLPFHMLVSASVTPSSKLFSTDEMWNKRTLDAILFTHCRLNSLRFSRTQRRITELEFREDVDLIKRISLKQGYSRGFVITERV